MGRSAGNKTGKRAGKKRRSEWIFELGVAVSLSLVAWLHRLLFLLSNRDRDWPFTIFYEGDARTYFLYARAMLAGQLYDEGIPFHPPGFAAFLAALHAALGAGGDGAQVPHFTVKAILAAVASLAVGLLYLLARPYLGRVPAALGALFLTYHFGHYVISVAPVSEGLYLTLLLLALLLWSRRLDHPLAAPGAKAGDWRHGLGLGVLGGVLALIRFESVLILGVLGAVGLAGVLLRRRQLAGAGLVALTPWLLVAAGWILVVAPWTVRNHLRLVEYNERMGERLSEPLPTFVPVTLYGPLNLALANQAGADGSFSPEALTGWTGGAALDLTLPTHLEWLLHGDAIAWRFVRQNPAEFLVLVAKKWRLSAEVSKLGFTQWNLPGGLAGVRRPVDVFVPDRSPGWWLWPSLVALGFVLAWRRGGGARRWAILTLLLTGCAMLTVGLFFGYVRQGLLYLPWWLTLAAVPLVELGSRLGIPGRHWRRLTALLVATLLGLAIWGSRADRNYRASASSTIDGHHLNPDDEVRLELIRE